MDVDGGASPQQRAVVRALERADLSLEQLWTRYFSLGGSAGLVELEAYLHGMLSFSSLQADVLAHAVNERLEELIGPARVPYNRQLRDARPARGPLAALVSLLEASHLSPPERLPGIVAAAGEALGVEIVLYLVDYDQRVLHPLDVEGRPARAPLAVDGTVPGRAYRTVELVASDADGQPRIWVPLLDGVERLGVLDVMVNDAAELHDPALREQCRWLAALISHLVEITSEYGDGLDLVRQRRSRNPAAELIWSLLPPLTAGTDAFVLAGRVEPAYEVGGDVFDFALSETCASLAIFDAMGHGLGAGLLAASAMSAYRSARRGGRDVAAQAQAIDKVIAEVFDNDGFVTGVLVDLDFATGRLRYVAAGHPLPLLLRRGKVVKSLPGGRRVPFGVGVEGMSLLVGEEVLEPGDWLVLHTDGLTEARDRSGAFFGEDRLGDVLERAASSGQPPPETVRRLMQAVLAHQQGVLQDDATILLAQWGGSHLAT